MKASHQRARKCRLQQGLTQQQVAKACRVTQQAYEKFERGETKRPRYIFELAKVLNTSAAWILTGVQEDVSQKIQPDVADNGKKVPVYSYVIDAKLTHIFSLDTAEVIDRIAPLPGFENTTGSIALYMQGDQLEPIFPHGTLLYLDRHKFPSKNKLCVCVYANDVSIFVYMGASGGCYNFKPVLSSKSAKIKIKEVNAIYRIVGAVYS